MSFVLTAARADDQGGVRLELKSLGSGKVLFNRILPTVVDPILRRLPTSWPTSRAASRRSAG